jgi:hypothetical protein
VHEAVPLPALIAVDVDVDDAAPPLAVDGAVLVAVEVWSLLRHAVATAATIEPPTMVSARRRPIRRGTRSVCRDA